MDLKILVFIVIIWFILFSTAAGGTLGLVELNDQKVWKSRRKFQIVIIKEFSHLAGVDDQLQVEKIFEQDLE